MRRRQSLVRMCRVSVLMRMGPAMTIGTSLRRERLIYLDEGRAQMFQHVSDNLVTLDQKSVSLDLAGRVSIADMPGQPWKFVASDFQKILGSSDNLDAPAVFKDERLTMIQRSRLGKVDQKAKPAGRSQNLTAQEPVFVCQRNGVFRADTCVRRGDTVRHGKAHAVTFRTAAGSVFFHATH